MTDLHDAFQGWLLQGARDELPRDVALHASACADCVQATAALDALASVDPGLAAVPPVRVAAARGIPRGFLPIAAAAAVLLLVVIGGIVFSGALVRGTPAAEGGVTTPTPGGAVLGGVPAVSETAGPTPSSTPSATASSSPSATATPTPLSSPGAAQSATPEPAVVVGPVPAPPQPVPTPLPTPRPTPTPLPTPAPTPPPAPTATPSPTPCLLDCLPSISPGLP